MTKTIFLIGFMGVGKSSLGKKLANKLNVTFIDTDDFIEQKTGLSIADYFAKNGEDAFRIVEKELLEQNDFKNAVVATGGGLPCFHDNMKLMNDKGITIFLNRPAKELQQRLANAKKQRPLIKALSDDELLDYITSKLNERLPYYEKATITLDRNNQSVEEIIKRISDIE
jgi:shikimate kinase